MQEVKNSTVKGMPSHYYQYRQNDVKKVIFNLEQLLSFAGKNTELKMTFLLKDLLKNFGDFLIKKGNTKDTFEVLSEDFVGGSDLQKIKQKKELAQSQDKLSGFDRVPRESYGVISSSDIVKIQ